MKLLIRYQSQLPPEDCRQFAVWSVFNEVGSDFSKFLGRISVLFCIRLPVTLSPPTSAVGTNTQGPKILPPRRLVLQLYFFRIASSRHYQLFLFIVAHFKASVIVPFLSSGRRRGSVTTRWLKSFRYMILIKITVSFNCYPILCSKHRVPNCDINCYQRTF